MARSAELGQLTGSEWHRLQDAVARLEQAWQQADDVNLARFLPPTPPSLRLLFLYELIKTDLQERCHRQRFVPLEDYPKRYPELGPVADLPTPLVYEEFRARYLYGDRPPLEAYRARFPARFEDLKRLVKQHPVETLRETLDCRHLVPDQTPASPLPIAQPASVTPLVEPLTPSLPSPAGPVTPAARPVVQGRLRLDGDFELLDRLGAGQFGEVFRARAPGGVEVAVKRLFRPLDDESTQRELQALDLLRSLHHPFLLQNLMNGAVDGRLVIVMELAEDSLNDRFKACRQEGLPGIPAEELVAYFLEAAEALDFLHGHNVMHRDIKPANLLRLRGHAKVADFGLARLHESHLADGTFCGTPLYMPPEVWRHQISVHSDQYSLAVTYVEMRLGRRLHDASDPITVGRQHLRATPDLEPLPRDEQAVLFRALAKNPDQRFPSCLEFVRALARAIAPPPPPPVRPAASRLAWLIRGVWLAIVLCLSVLVWRLWPNGTSHPPPQPPSPPPRQVRGWLPSPDFIPGEGAELSHGLYSRISYPLKDAAPLVFLLIRSEKAGDLPAYYILRDKVSNEQFHAILKKRRMQELLREYEKKHPGSVGRKWNQSRIEHVCRYAALGLPVNSWAPLAGCAAVATADSVWREPVFYVTVTEAYCFAVCVGEEYGALPTVNQWEKAGGRHKGAKGPWDSKPQQRGPEKPQRPGVKPEGIAVSIPLPLPIGISSADVSWCGCQDMSGNGGEWMRNVKVPRAGYHFVPLPKPTIDDAVLLRGAAFYDFNPFTFAAGDDTNPPLEYHKSIDYVSFRMVLEVPPDR